VGARPELLATSPGLKEVGDWRSGCCVARMRKGCGARRRSRSSHQRPATIQDSHYDNAIIYRSLSQPKPGADS